jgi:hypothetical protein
MALTSDPGFWRGAGSNGVIDAAFHLTEARLLPAVMAWAAHASSGTTRGRETAHTVLGSYTCAWKTYSTVADPSQTSEFRYLLLDVPAGLPRQPAHDAPREDKAQPMGARAGRSGGAQRGGGARHEILAAARDLATRSADGTFAYSACMLELAADRRHIISCHLLTLHNVPFGGQIRVRDQKRGLPAPGKPPLTC